MYANIFSRKKIMHPMFDVLHLSTACIRITFNSNHNYHMNSTQILKISVFVFYQGLLTTRGGCRI